MDVVDVVDVVSVVSVVSWDSMRGQGAIKIWPVREHQTSAGLNTPAPNVKYHFASVGLAGKNTEIKLSHGGVNIYSKFELYYYNIRPQLIDKIYKFILPRLN